MLTSAISFAFSKLRLRRSSSSGGTSHATAATPQPPVGTPDSALTDLSEKEAANSAPNSPSEHSSNRSSDASASAAATASEPPRQRLRALSRATPSGSPPQQTWTQKQAIAIQRARRDLDDRRDIIILENMAHGSVADLIEKMVRRRQRLSNRALWLVFECLFKGCLAMAYPTSFFDQTVNPWTETMPLRDETVPQEFYGGRLSDAPLVHFDLDPQNGKFAKGRE